MAYVIGNPRTKKVIKEWIASGRIVEVYQSGPFGPHVKDGVCYLEGPHYPECHRWYANAIVKDGYIIKIR